MELIKNMNIIVRHSSRRCVLSGGEDNTPYEAALKKRMRKREKEGRKT